MYEKQGENIMNKKLQVFVSSTYTDLIEERQAAVHAILDAGHIPAGMELFKAGDKSQLETIYKWIDESDVYMLILGGRYGSIESKSGKSYTQLEYEYALKKDIPVFAVVLSESFLIKKINLLGLSNAMEQKAPDKYQDFKSLVTSKIIQMVDDCKDIKISIHSTLNEFIHNYDLIGWIRNNNAKDTSLLFRENNVLLKENNLLKKQIQKLLKENNLLKKQIQKLQEQLNPKEFSAKYSFDELINLLKSKEFIINDKITNCFDFFVSKYSKFNSCSGFGAFSTYEYCKFLEEFSLIHENHERTDCSSKRFYFKISKQGILFHSLLEKNNIISI